MKYQKSPFPYLVLLTCILSIAIYTNVTVDKKIDQPLVYSVTKLRQTPVPTNSLEDSSKRDHAYLIACPEK